jgi:hypothetical protein
MKKIFAVLNSILLTSILVLSGLNVFSQINMDSTIGVTFVKLNFGYYAPANDFADRFGNTASVGGEIGYKTKSNWQFSFKMEGNFGNEVKEPSIINFITNGDGYVTTQGGSVTGILIEQRGYNFHFMAGKIFNFKGKNKNSGLLVSAGAGFLSHRINLDYRDGEVLQLTNEMEKGYDRLSSGFSISQFIGYQYYGKTRLINFYAGIEGIQAFTKNKRGYNYDLQQKDTKSRFDSMYGIKIGWIIPFYKKSTQEFYYY